MSYPENLLGCYTVRAGQAIRPKKCVLPRKLAFGGITSIQNETQGAKINFRKGGRKQSENYGELVTASSTCGWMAEWQKEMESEHSSQFNHWVNLLRREINEKKAGRRDSSNFARGLWQAINGRRPTDRPLEATSDIDLVESVVHIGGQFSVTTQDQFDNGVALDTNLRNGLLDTNGVSNFALLVLQLMHCCPMHFTTQLKGMPWLTMVNLVNLHLRQVLTTPGANLWDGTHFFGGSNFNLASTTTQFEDSGSQLQVGATHSLIQTSIFLVQLQWRTMLECLWFDTTYDALIFNPQFDRPELRGNLGMGTDHFNLAGTDQMDSLPLLPMPALTPPSIVCSTLPIEPEIQLQRKNRQESLKSTNIIEGARLRNKSCRARGEA
ncbi:hypothetical protein K438DRAFT_1778052 [Mycena galopus ATCC 62051]|nr:hypothetical protein K438DRAFT_1778052 [Mycena galopus ATCC 62051]